MNLRPAALVLLPLLAGCAILPEATQQDVSPAAITGRVFGGQQPVSGATVTVWQMGTGGYGTSATALATTLSSPIGTFGFAANAYTCAYSNAPVYITAQGGNPGSGTNANLVLAAGLGNCGNAHSAIVNINEVTTAATAFALGQFFTTAQGVAPSADSFAGSAAGSGTYNTGLITANSATIPALVDLPSGTAMPSSATKTVESAKLYSIANTLAACVNTSGQTSTTETASLCGQLFNLTKAPGATARPLDTLQAAVNMSLYPYQNVAALFNLAPASSPFIGLAAAPNDWTLAVSYTSPALGLAIAQGTSSNLDIDATGRVWFATDTATSHGIAYFDPASGTFNGPYATALTRPQYVALDLSGKAWATDVASPLIVSTSTASPAAAGTSYTATSGAGGGPLLVDTDNTVLFAYTTTAAAHNVGKLSAGVFGIDNANAFQGVPTGLSFNGNANSGIHSLFAATNSASIGCAEEYSGTGQGNNTQYSSGPNCTSGGIASTAYNNGYQDWLISATTRNQVGSNGPDDFFTPPVPVSAPQGIATDGVGHLWIANSGNGSVSTLSVNVQNFADSDYHQISPIVYLHDTTHGNTMTKPYGIALDRSGNVWISNAGCVSTSTTLCTAGSFTLTELIGAAAPTLTPLAAQTESLVATRPSNVLQPTPQAGSPSARPSHIH